MGQPLHLLNCQPGLAALSPAELTALLPQLPDWQVVGGCLERRFGFANYDQTMAFVNAVAALAQAHDHHPDMLVRWGDCMLRWQTHSASGLTLNDLVCAAKVDMAVLPRS